MPKMFSNPLFAVPSNSNDMVCPGCGGRLTEQIDQYDTYDCAECGRTWHIRES